jgi:CBS domain-containing protein
MMDTTVSDIMTTEVLTAREDWTLDQLAAFLVDHNVSGVPVASASDELVGVVSMTDIVRHNSLPVKDNAPPDTHEYFLSSIGRQFASEEIAGFRLDAPEGALVRDVMTPMIFQVRRDTPVQEAADIMIKGNIHRVLVTGEGMQLLGIVTTLDMLKVVRDL